MQYVQKGQPDTPYLLLPVLVHTIIYHHPPFSMEGLRL